jgi:transposase InsO family protein
VIQSYYRKVGSSRQAGHLHQDSQFTGAAFTGALSDNGIAIGMDGKGAWRDNAFVERLWRSVKYEEVYLRAYDSVSEARASIGRYLAFYNPASQRPSVYVAKDRALARPVDDRLRRWSFEICAGERSMDRREAGGRRQSLRFRRRAAASSG